MKYVVVARSVLAERFVVEADTGRQAGLVVHREMEERAARAPVDPAVLMVFVECHSISPSVSDDDRPSTWRCMRCGEVSMKETWGPGRVRCPSCKEIQPSAGEDASP
jgi:hypothetical protein